MEWHRPLLFCRETIKFIRCMLRRKHNKTISFRTESLSYSAENLGTYPNVKSLTLNSHKIPESAKDV